MMKRQIGFRMLPANNCEGKQGGEIMQYSSKEVAKQD
jgi:hypothetical protein